VRFSNRTPRRSSSCRIVWLRAKGVTPRRDAAARKLRLSATATVSSGIQECGADLANLTAFALLKANQGKKPRPMAGP
jgi:hypothetical protein